MIRPVALALLAAFAAGSAVAEVTTSIRRQKSKDVDVALPAQAPAPALALPTEVIGFTTSSGAHPSLF